MHRIWTGDRVTWRIFRPDVQIFVYSMKKVCISIMPAVFWNGFPGGRRCVSSYPYLTTNDRIHSGCRLPERSPGWPQVRSASENPWELPQTL
jgi:hypothetical protein